MMAPNRHRARRRATAVGLLVTILAAGAAHAQPTEPAPPASAEPLPSEPPPVTPPAPAACVPVCRSGFMCSNGTCVSACNPPCSGDDICSAQGECSRRQAPPPATEPSNYAPSTTNKRAHGVNVHDGFYFRIAIGFGGLVGNGEVRDNGALENEGSITSAGAVGELALGGTVGSGVVIGGGTWNAVPIGPTMKYRTLARGETAASPEVEVRDPVVTPFGLLGPFVDWYVDPQAGFHVQAAAGLANGGYKEPGDNEDTVVLWGAGGMLGVGQEWWIADQWSMGILARATLGSVSGTDPSDSNEEHSAFFVAPGGLMTFTCH